MKSLRTSNPRRLAIVALLFVIVNTVLVFLARDIIREMIVLPLAYLLFLVKIFIDSTPQLFFWLAVVLISGWIAYRSLYRKRKLVDDFGPSHMVSEEPGSQGRMSFWVTKVNIARRYGGSYFGSSFHLAMSRLLVDLLAHRYRLSTGEVEDRVRRKTLGLPPDIEEYLLLNLGNNESHGSWYERWWRKFLLTIQNWLNWPAPRGAAGSLSADPLDGIDRVIYFMEEELEVSHEHSGQSSR